MLASQDTQRSETDTQSGTMTIAQTVWGAAGGPTVNASLNSSQQQDKQTTHNNASLTADNLNIVTSGDANIIGGNLEGTTAVNMAIGGDLTLESVQDRFSGSNKGFGISGGISLGGVFTNENGAAANSKEIKTTAVGQSDGVSGVNGGVNASSGRHQSTETVLSDITGATVNINVAGHTQLTGALIAALDEEGNDTGNLNLNTGSLNFTDLSNRSYSSNQSFGVSTSVGIGGKENPGDPNQTNINSSTYSYQNESSQSLDKTLATVGQGNITVGGEAAEPEGLNRDVDAINKELYAVDRQQGNIDLTVDHRLLSEDGRKQIAEDAKRTEILGSAIVDIAKESVSLTGSGDGEDSLRDHIGNKQDYFTATKNFTQNADNAEHMATLGNDNATPEQKQAAYTALVNEIATYMGVDPTEAKVLMENDPKFAGYHSRDTGNIYINDLANSNATEAVNTVGHETQHYLDNQQNPDAERTEQYISNRENYAHIMGDATADYLDFNFAQSGSTLANGNSHSTGSSLADIERNQNLLLENRGQLAQENPDSLDSCRLCSGALKNTNPLVTNPVLPAAPGMMQEDTPDQNAAAAIALERDLKKLGELLGLGSADTSAAEIVDIDNVINERVALEVKRKQFLDSGSLDHNKLNEITEQINTLLSGLSPEQRLATENKVSEFVAFVYGGNQTSSGGAPVSNDTTGQSSALLANQLPDSLTEIENVVSGFVTDVPGGNLTSSGGAPVSNDTTGQSSALLANQLPDSRTEIENVVSGFVTDVPGGNLTSNGGFQQADEPVITALPNPVPENPGPIILDNTPPPVPGQIGGFEQGESLPPLGGTPVHEGHWSDSIYLSESDKPSGEFSGTIWDNVVATEDVYSSTPLPRSFELSVPNGTEVWLNPNATKHFDEYAKSLAEKYPPAVVNLKVQLMVESMQSAINTATSNGVPYNERVTIEDWQLEIRPAFKEGQLPTVVHARYTGNKG